MKNSKTKTTLVGTLVAVSAITATVAIAEPANAKTTTQHVLKRAGCSEKNKTVWADVRYTATWLPSQKRWHKQVYSVTRIKQYGSGWTYMELLLGSDIRPKMSGNKVSFYQSYYPGRTNRICTIAI